MNKELTALEALNIVKSQRENCDFDEEYDIIETALKRNVELEKININLLKENTNLRERPLDFYSDVEKKLKALEIIKEKRLDIGDFLSYLESGNRSYYDYCYDWFWEYDYVPKEQLTQEQFELLKEMLK